MADVGGERLSRCHRKSRRADAATADNGDESAPPPREVMLDAVEIDVVGERADLSCVVAQHRQDRVAPCGF